jgi:glycosyltransferase involved in cell wall biosynthesis
MTIFSIIIPIYNVGQYLRQCIESVITQDFIDYEIILVDDGSSDNCPDICDEYAAKDRRFKVIHKPNGGLSDARNVGIRTAIGEYIVLLDSDDLLIKNDALKNLYAIIKMTTAKVIFNSNITIFITNDFISQDSINKNIVCGTAMQIYKQIMCSQKKLMAGWMFTVRLDILLQHDLFFKKGILHEDEQWMPRVMDASNSIVVNHNLFYAYRHARYDSITATIIPKRLFDKIAIINEYQYWIAHKSYSLDIKKILQWRSAQLWYGTFLQSLSLKENYHEQYKQIIHELNIIKHVLIKGKGLKYLCFFILICTIDIKNVATFLERMS